MNILIFRKFGWISVSFLFITLVGCGNSVSMDTLRPLWTKQVNQEVTPLMKDVFAPVSSQVTSELLFYSDDEWEVSEDKLPNFKFGLQHANKTSNGDFDPTLVVHVKLDQPFDTYQINQLEEQIWSAKEQLRIMGITTGRVKLEYGGKTYFSGVIQAMNDQGDMGQFFQVSTKG